MEKLVKGDVVVLPFPFSDLKSSKKRPALVISNPLKEDVLLAQITSQASLDEFSVSLTKNDFLEGFLPVESFVKVYRLFSADLKIILYKAGSLRKNKIKEIEVKLIDFIKR